VYPLNAWAGAGLTPRTVSAKPAKSNNRLGFAVAARGFAAGCSTGWTRAPCCWSRRCARPSPRGSGRASLAKRRRSRACRSSRCLDFLCSQSW